MVNCIIKGVALVGVAFTKGDDGKMLSSKSLLEKSGLSRATLNNYIGLGLLPKPEVRQPDSDKDRARRLGYFPDSAINKIKEIDSLKKRGMRMSEIVAKLKITKKARSSPPAPKKADANPIEVPPQTSPEASPKKSGGEKDKRPASSRRLRLSIGDLDHPAYLVNNNFEIAWSNRQAEETILQKADGLSSEITNRNVFRLLSESGFITGAEGRSPLFQFHLSIAKGRLSKAALLTLDGGMDEDSIDFLADQYDGTDAAAFQPILDTEINLAPPGAEPARYQLYATTFREGIFFAYVPCVGEDDALLTLLARRDLVIRDLLRDRKPYMTPLAVLVADIQSSMKICAELPSEEYFTLINQVWGTMEPKLRKYHATHGKHVGDGILYYFFPRPDCNYVLNALRCAQEMKEEMVAIDRHWRKQKNWSNRLELNMGLDEGQEWFGAYQTPTHLEFTVLGETVNRAARISDFAEDGSIWVSKNMLGSLNAREMEGLSYGIRRRGPEGDKITVGSTYSRLSNLVDLSDPANQKMRDIAALPVTEILDTEFAPESG